MNTDDKAFRRLNADWRAGLHIAALRFGYNTIVSAKMPDGTFKTGWVVAASFEGREPIYTIETTDGTGNLHCPESSLSPGHS